MSKKSEKKAAVAKPIKLNAAMQKLYASAGQIGHDMVGGFQAGVALIKAASADAVALERIGKRLVAGCIVRYMTSEAGYTRRTKALAFDAKLDDAARIMALPVTMPKGDKKVTIRSTAEHLACRNASNYLTRVRTAAGIVSDPAKNPDKNNKRKPRPGSNKVETVATLPVDLVKSAPTLKGEAAQIEYFANVAAAMALTVKKNKITNPKLSTPVQDFLTAMKAINA